MTLEDISKEVKTSKKVDAERLYNEAQNYLNALSDAKRQEQKIKNWHLLEILGMMIGR